ASSRFRATYPAFRARQEAPSVHAAPGQGAGRSFKASNSAVASRGARQYTPSGYHDRGWTGGCGVARDPVRETSLGGSTMRAAIFVLGLALALVVGVQAQDDKEVTLKGTITCAKCDLKKESSCMTVIKVKEGDKDVVYYFDKDSHKKNHKQICQEAKEGS